MISQALPLESDLSKYNSIESMDELSELNGAEERSFNGDEPDEPMNRIEFKGP